MKYLILLLILISGVIAGTITPKMTVKTGSSVLDFVIRDSEVWAATANGEALQISSKGKILSKVTLPSLTNAWGETMPQKIMSIDLSPDKETMALAGEDGCLYVSRKGGVNKTSFSTKTVIKKIAFISDSRIILALLSNEVMIYDLRQSKVIVSLSAGTSPLSDMALSPDRRIAAIAGEAGIVSLIDTQNGKVVRKIRGGNVDNIYKIDFQNNRIITAGQDRRAIIYTVDGKSYVRYDGTFLIYAAALSPMAKYAAVTLDEENQITVIDTIKRQKIALAKGHQATLNRIVFIDEKHFVSSADENKILFWEIP